MKKLAPVLVVDRIEPCLPFWVDRLGFEKTVEVPESDRLGFVILASGPVVLNASRHWHRAQLEGREVEVLLHLCPGEQFESLDTEIEAIVEGSVEFAKAGTDPKPEDALKYVYA